MTSVMVECLVIERVVAVIDICNNSLNSFMCVTVPVTEHTTVYVL